MSYDCFSLLILRQIHAECPLSYFPTFLLACFANTEGAVPRCSTGKDTDPTPTPSPTREGKSSVQGRKVS